ncbi:ZIP family metal transporter [Usitatibacter palustris]|uniref:Zinc transporter ZupT n=1 Tax=Usitatibacter palustris TaxID=2732487 RepID=A0A6M4HBY2_9PROT|nr:ZIP family metal transporter [Usitatibacter palustris]QJR15487.1 Zinc transporter ZupT [Usitatibacter palustris]
MTTLAWILLACLAGGALSLGIAALVAFRVQARWIPTLVSYAVGALLGAVFLDMIPHIFQANPNPGRSAAMILAGILVFFILEKLLLWRHHHHHGEEIEGGHDHGHDNDQGRSGWMIVAGDSFHNFTDGVIIAGAFIADIRLGVITALAILAHEIPQEIGDFLILLHSGFSKKKALLLNVVSSLATVLGALIAYFALAGARNWVPDLLAIAAASMIYVAVADLIPGLHKRAALRETLGQVSFIGLGIATIWIIHEGLG